VSGLIALQNLGLLGIQILPVYSRSIVKLKNSMAQAGGWSAIKDAYHPSKDWQSALGRLAPAGTSQ